MTDSWWYSPAICCVLGLGLFWILTTSLVGAIVCPIRLRLPPWMSWSYARFPEVLGPYHRIYVFAGNLVLEAFPLIVWRAGWVPSSPLWLPSLAAEVGMASGWVMLLVYYARRSR